MPSFSLLASETLVHIKGPDSQTFLQGQTSCDANLVNRQHAAPGVYCTPQGRVVCDFVLTQLGEAHYGLRMRKDIAGHAASVLGKYIVFSKAEIEPDEHDWIAVGIWGDDAVVTLKQVFNSIPMGQWEVASSAGYALVQTDSAQHQFELYIKADHELLNELKSKSTWEKESTWQTQQILAGIARIEAATVESLVPQVLNYDLTGHISFTKGCYTGQEVIARLHYRGKSKRRLYISKMPELARPGDPVFSADSAQSIGNVINCAAGEENLALVSATIDAATGPLNLFSADGPEIALQNPPYPLQQED